MGILFWLFTKEFAQIKLANMKIFIVLACLALTYTYAEDDKCLEGYRACAQKIKDSGATGYEAIKMRMACGNAYLKCRFDQSGIKDKVICVGKCKKEMMACKKNGGKLVDCLKKGYECVKACRQ